MLVENNRNYSAPQGMSSYFSTSFRQKSLNHNMKAASIVNGAYFVEQCNKLRKQLKPIALF